MFTHQPTITLGLVSLYRRLGAYTSNSYSRFRPKPYYAASQDDQDNAFLIRLKEENEEKFMEHIFRSFYTPLCKTVYNITRDTEATEDIVQDVFMKIWRRKEQLDLKQSLKSYLFRSSVNTALNYLEKNRRNSSMEEGSEDDLRYSSNSTEDQLRFHEVSQQIDEAVKTLPPKCRTVFALSRYEEMSYAEIADQLSISVKAVEKHMGKALKMMREQLKSFINHSA